MHTSVHKTHLGMHQIIFEIYLRYSGVHGEVRAKKKVFGIDVESYELMLL